ncbi:hypothetical protein [Streptomyces sp. NPDC001315]
MIGYTTRRDAIAEGAGSALSACPRTIEKGLGQKAGGLDDLRGPHTP